MPGPVRSEDAHQEAEELLPWYATGRLDAADRAFVESHLASCPECQRQVSVERRLIDEFQSLIPEVDSGWARLRGRIERPTQTPSWIARTVAEISNLFRRPAVAALAAGQLAFLIVAAALLSWTSRPAYEALGAAEASAAANVIVIFRPEATEEELRSVLRAADASVVRGPTEADAYLLRVPAKSRGSALAKLRSDSSVTMAEPIDEAAQ